jgi:hypothetical protein
MYTHNPPEQFSLVTRAESTCVECCEPSKMDHPLPPPSEASSGSRSIFKFEISWGQQPSTSTLRDYPPSAPPRRTKPSCRPSDTTMSAGHLDPDGGGGRLIRE